jgi:hypothetical protein
MNPKNHLLGITLLGLAMLICALAPSAGMAVTAADVETSFYPYKNGAPKFPGLSSGMIISSANVDQFKDIIDVELFKMLKDGWLEMKATETTSFDLHPNYVKATTDNLGKVSLGAEVGQINGFVAGRPFPEEPQVGDSRAGEKLAWNFKFGYNWGDSAVIMPFYWKFRDMKKEVVERTLKFNFNFLNFKHRVDQDPKPDITPNPSELFRATYVQVLEPYDVANTQLLIHRAENDQKLDNSWLYLGFQRRVRRLATGQITDAFLGSDVMIEDFEGYNGRVCDMKWTYKATRNMMLPFYNHNDMVLDEETHKNDPDGYKMVSFGGKGGCFQNVNWQLRKAYEVESVPVDPSHPIKKRVHFIDAQTFAQSRVNIYDRAGNLWKCWILGKAHPDYHLPKNKGTGVAIDDSVAQIDVQAMHCTTAQFKGIVDRPLSPPDVFNVQNLRATGN